MNHELGNAYLGQMIAKQAMQDALYGKPKAKKTSFIKRMMKKVISA
ncbi:hypothetical protein OPW41_09920 [Vibrio europaeus]|uniref:Uncharacterized protein n=2 Tax=Vibrio oreintalis group TaxID=1891919 RepID=A0AAE7AY75_9VIBR|nr:MULTISPECIES: hypothetical protein [Vibrio oreintalis group]EGU54247.1 hypothetical protein VITU9109_12183 [Vibrio tubiashii ATCC 19109]EIF02296.1 hypothetical protein VT1337_19632 [Vibrio tubiashii NCIMB 1337 = ATCC 19106]MCG9581087.1 hypothetical protein [Vibrio tubiashii]MCG9614678.1 hypothetical protein [Vibrio tubiashii]MCG9686023.1 hypothetical protein [Vibrio tubiashii]